MKYTSFLQSIIILINVIVFSCVLNAQEMITPLYNNVVLQNYKQDVFRKYRSIDTFDLNKYPFWDDFSGNSPYPKDSMWVDNFVFINSSLAVQPVSYNTATFDGLDESGNPYSPGVINSKGKIADKLTSVPIDLSSFSLADSIYLSFYYQPQGLGDAPEPYDSFILEFKPIRFWNGFNWDSNAWVRIWSASGSALHDFKQIIIHVKPFKIDTSQVTDTVASFYHQAFQFRFMNYGSLSGNLDHWHLDYVYLNKGRSLSDTSYKDISVSQKPISLLKDYISIPYSHFDGNKSMLRQTLKIHANKLWKAPLNLIGRANVYNLKDSSLIMATGDDKTIYLRDTTLTLAFYVPDSLNLSTVASADTVEFRTLLTSKIIDDHKINDQAEYIQGFYNYYAYDDGTAEMGYGVYPGKYGMVACRFDLAANAPATDSLRAVYIYFNRSDQYVGNTAFNILVWNNGDYKTPPVSVEARVPTIQTGVVNGYYLFLLDTVLAVNGTFYIGWEQNSEFFINVGVDMNYYELKEDPKPINPAGKTFFYATDNWAGSSLKGVLMMRPILSSKKIVINSVYEQKLNVNPISVYPNPAFDKVFVSGQLGNFSYSIFSIEGKCIKKGIVENRQINVSDIEKGIYILQLNSLETNEKSIHKLLINK